MSGASISPDGAIVGWNSKEKSSPETVQRPPDVDRCGLTGTVRPSITISPAPRTAPRGKVTRDGGVVRMGAGVRFSVPDDPEPDDDDDAAPVPRRLAVTVPASVATDSEAVRAP